MPGHDVHEVGAIPGENFAVFTAEKERAVALQVRNVAAVLQPDQLEQPAVFFLAVRNLCLLALVLFPDQFPGRGEE